MVTATEFFHNLSGIPFIIQFVSELRIEGEHAKATQITSYLITASSENDARQTASRMLDSLSDSYRNSEGAIVHVKCLGIHSVEEVDYVDGDGAIELGVFQFSNSTTAQQLIDSPDARGDLPLIE